jgi:hypothetical protein
MYATGLVNSQVTTPRTGVQPSQQRHALSASATLSAGAQRQPSPPRDAHAAKEVLVLRDDVDRNKAAIAQLNHALRAATAVDHAQRRACEEHLAGMHDELGAVLRDVQRLEQQRDGPTVPRAALASAAQVLDCKQQDLAAAKRDVVVLERALLAHLDDERLHLRQLAADIDGSLLPVLEGLR